MEVYVITNLENGWDDVCGVCLSLESLNKYFQDRFVSDWENCHTLDDFLDRVEGSGYYITATTAY